MPQFENTMGIDEISFWVRSRCFCPLGDDFYTNQFKVSFVPGKMIPDYLDIQQEINERIESKPLTVEDAVAVMFDIVNDYEPLELYVESHGDDAVHFPVTVIKRK